MRFKTLSDILIGAPSMVKLSLPGLGTLAAGAGLFGLGAAASALPVGSLAAQYGADEEKKKSKAKSIKSFGAGLATGIAAPKIIKGTRRLLGNALSAAQGGGGGPEGLGATPGGGIGGLIQSVAPMLSGLKLSHTTSPNYPNAGSSFMNIDLEIENIVRVARDEHNTKTAAANIPNLHSSQQSSTMNGEGLGGSLRALAANLRGEATPARREKLGEALGQLSPDERAELIDYHIKRASYGLSLLAESVGGE